MRLFNNLMLSFLVLVLICCNLPVLAEGSYDQYFNPNNPIQIEKITDPNTRSITTITKTNSESTQANPDENLSPSTDSLMNQDECSAIDLSDPEVIVKLNSNSTSSIFNQSSNQKIRNLKALRKNNLKLKSIKPLLARVNNPNPKRASVKLKSNKAVRTKMGFDNIYLLKVDIRSKSSNKKALEKNAYSCKEFLNVIEEINKDPNVEYAEPNYQVQINSQVNDPLFNSHGEYWSNNYDELWGLKKIEADKAWDLGKGEGAIVAVVDTGVDYNHPDLWNNIWVDPDIVSDHNSDGTINLNDLDLNGNKTLEANEIVADAIGYDFAYKDTNPIDGHFHGTHVAGTIAAEGDNNLGVIGVAPRAKIMILKGLNDDGSGYHSDLANALIYAAEHGADISNNSWGGTGNTETLRLAFVYANQIGMLNIAAAGNSNRDVTSFYPASYEDVISVAAIDYSGYKSSFSNFGFEVDIAAPGSNIVSSFNKIRLSNIQYGTDLTYQYGSLSGTSMASPHVAGVAALIKAFRPGINNQEIESILSASTTLNPSSSTYYGKGLVNAFKALQIRMPIAKLNPDLAYSAGQAILQITGSASGDNFDHYEVKISSYDSNNALLSFASSTEIKDSTLAELDVSGLANNDYKISLEVYSRDGNMFRVIRKISITNKVPREIENLRLYDTVSFMDDKVTLRWSNVSGVLDQVQKVEITRRNLDTNQESKKEIPFEEVKGFYLPEFKFTPMFSTFSDLDVEANTRYKYSISLVNDLGKSDPRSIQVSTQVENEDNMFVSTILRANSAYDSAEDEDRNFNDAYAPLPSSMGGLDFDSKGNLFITSSAGIRMLDFSKQKVSTIPRYKGSHSLAINSKDEIYVARLGDNSGKLITLLGKIDSTHSTVSELTIPAHESIPDQYYGDKVGDQVITDLKVNKKTNDIYFLENLNTVYKLTNEVELTKVFECSFEKCVIRDYDFDYAGNIYMVANFNDGGIRKWSRIIKFDGSTISFLNSPNNEDYRNGYVNGFRDNATYTFITNIAVDRDTGELYFNDELNFCIRKMDTNGFFSTVVGKEHFTKNDVRNLDQPDDFDFKTFFLSIEDDFIFYNKSIFFFQNVIVPFDDDHPFSGAGYSSLRRISSDKSIPVVDFFTLDKKTTNSINLSWTLKTNPSQARIHKFNIYRGLGTNNLNLISSSLSTGYNDNNLQPDTKYYYQIGTVNAFGQSLSEIVSFTTSPVPTNQNPTASFSFSPPSPFIGDLVTFDASLSRDLDGTIASYDWDFNNDGIIDAGVVSPIFSFNQPGTYSVKLTVKDNLGAKNSLTKDIVVKDIEKVIDPKENLEPSFNFTVGQGVRLAMVNKLGSTKNTLVKIPIIKSTGNHNKALRLSFNTTTEFQNLINFGPGDYKLISALKDSMNLKLSLAKRERFLRLYPRGTIITIPIRVTDVDSGYLEDRYILVKP